MEKFNVIVYNVNKRCFEPYDIMPTLVREYNDAKDKPETFLEFKEFVERKSLYYWWSKCEWELILTDWPTGKTERKIDVYYQVMMNIDVITELLMRECGKTNEHGETNQTKGYRYKFYS